MDDATIVKTQLNEMLVSMMEQNPGVKFTFVARLDGEVEDALVLVSNEVAMPCVIKSLSDASGETRGTACVH